MYKRKSNQVSIFDDSAMFGGIPLNPENEWVKPAKLIPWWVFEEKYAEQFPSGTGQPADSLRMALGSQIIKERYRFSEMTAAHRDESVSAILRRAEGIHAGGAISSKHDDAIPDAARASGSFRKSTM